MITNAAIFILMVCTSAGTMDNGKSTGLWLEEFAEPYRIFTEAGIKVRVASVDGGTVPVDERSMTDAAKPENAERYLSILQDTIPLAEVQPERYDAVFFPGGHGTMFDLPDNPHVQKVVEHFIQAGKPSAFVCHGPAALVGATDQQGDPIVKGRRVTSFTDEEEQAVDLVESVPFLLESRLRQQGAYFAEADNFKNHVVVDDELITGQNPASSAGAAREILKMLDVNVSPH